MMSIVERRGTNKKCLIAEDVQFALEHICGLFQSTNLDVITATDGNAAFEMIKEEQPDIVLLDVSLPGMSGDDCCRSVKALPHLKRVPIIMLTSSRNETEVKKCLAAGCDDLIPKPILKVDGFYQTLRKFIDIAVREHKRVPVDIPVTFFNENREHLGHLRDIGEGGTLIETDTHLPKGSALNLIFSVPGARDSVEATGKVVRISRPSNNQFGLGVQFMGMTLPGRMAIKSFVSADSNKVK